MQAEMSLDEKQDPVIKVVRGLHSTFVSISGDYEFEVNVFTGSNSYDDAMEFAYLLQGFMKCDIDIYNVETKENYIGSREYKEIEL